VRQCRSPAIRCDLFSKAHVKARPGAGRLIEGG